MTRKQQQLIPTTDTQEVTSQPNTQNDQVQSMLMAAIEKGLPVETLERLMVMRKDLKAEYAKEEYYKAMAVLQAEMPVIKKDKHVKFATKTGDRVDYHYAPIESIVEQTRDLIGKHGFSYRYRIEESPTQIKVFCIATHKDGHSEEASFTSTIGGTGLMSATQKSTGAVTQGKRIALCNVFGISTGDEDNDGNNQDAPRNDKATDEQKAAIDDLAAKAGIEKAYVTKRVRELYNVSYTEITKTQAEGIIAMLTKKVEDNAKTQQTNA